VIQHRHPAVAPRRQETILRRPPRQRPLDEEPAEVAPQGVEPPHDRLFNAGNGQEVRAVESVAPGHSIVIGQADKAVSRIPVAGQEFLRLQPAVGAAGVDMQLGLAKGSGRRVGIEDLHGPLAYPLFTRRPS
jgi:hypothetical protein